MISTYTVINDGNVLYESFYALVSPGAHSNDGYYVAYKPITLPCISFMFIKIKFINFHSCMMFVMKSMSLCND